MNSRKIVKKRKVSASSRIESKRRVKGRKPGAVGEVHFIHPKHVVTPKELSRYLSNKGNANPRPVAIVSEKIDKTVGIAQIYGTPGKSNQVKRRERTKLRNTKMTKQSWIDSNEKTKSESTKKPFVSGVKPLDKKSSRVHPRDLISRKNNIKIKQKKSK
ncbi:MAG: hypothetical protein RBQ97_08580 [Acholeplasma sp.]|nr:hypothetical protein [Acholeplasma sp.]